MSCQTILGMSALKSDSFCFRRVWCRLKEWRAVDIKLVGEEKISGIVAADFKDFGEHKPILPSDHFGIFVTFQKQS